MKTATIEVTGLFTAECGLGVERQLSKLRGVKRAAVNAVSGTATVEFDEKSIALESIKAVVRDCGYGCTGVQQPHHV
ncbi:MAG: heavy-metal-associated domain-containing protein, partial [Burkholderiales bacterium]|nr:heavy-metal-associated domain-containing protein [Burkholderiales bacterium]